MFNNSHQSSKIFIVIALVISVMFLASACSSDKAEVTLATTTPIPTKIPPTSTPEPTPTTETDNVTKHLKAAEKYFADGEYEKAILELEAVVELEPDNIDAYQNLALSHVQNGDYDKAIPAWSKVIEAKPDKFTLYYERGRAYFNLRQYDEAIDDFNQAIELENNDALSYKVRGKAYAFQDKHEQALADFTKAIELDPEADEAYFNRAAVRSQIGNADDLPVIVADYIMVLKVSQDPDLRAAAQERLENFVENSNDSPLRQQAVAALQGDFSSPDSEASDESSSQAAECDPNQVIENLYTEFTHEQFTFVYSGNFVPGQGTNLTLSIWFIDYLLNPEVGTNQNEISNNAGTALTSALNAARAVEDTDACVDKLFVELNPIVVDRNYNGWISFAIPTGVLPEKIDLSDPEFTAILDQYANLSYVRNDPPDPNGSPPAGACDWPTALLGLEGRFLSQSNGNTAFFFVRDSHGNNVWAYLDNNNVALAPQNYLGEQVTGILAEISCLYPEPDNLIVQTLSESGTILFSGRLPKEGILTKDMDKFVLFP